MAGLRLPIDLAFHMVHSLPLVWESTRHNMKQCPYCGKFYPDDDSVCVVDGNSLAACGVTAQFDKHIQWEEKKPRPVRSTVSQIVWMSVAVLMFALALSSVMFVTQALKSGQTLSVKVIFGSTAIVHRNDQPEAFWKTVGLLGVNVVVLPIVGIFLLREVSLEHKRKVLLKQHKQLE
jgi:hypothetical protein